MASVTENEIGLDMNCVDFLLTKSFISLPLEQQLEIKRLGRQTPEMSIVQQDGKVKRKFSMTWFEKKKWLTASPTIKKLFCWPCLLFAKSGCAENVWGRKGYCELKNLSIAVCKHEVSKNHLDSCVKLKLFGNIRIDEAISKAKLLATQQHNEKVETNREILKRLIDVIIHLGKQELAFRGHYEHSESDNRGNYLESLSLVSRYDKLIKDHLESNKIFKGTSKEIQNELIYCIATTLQNFIDKEINNSPFLAIQADETTDISTKEQLSLIIRYVDAHGDVKERFLGFYDISANRNAESISTLILKELNIYNIKEKLVCQTYDGASVMSGHLSGVQARVKKECPFAIFVHCYCHKLNLVLMQGTNIPQVKLFFASLIAFHNFFSQSPKRTQLLQDIQDLNQSKRSKMVSPSTTRWAFKGRAVSTIYDNYNILEEACETIMTTWLNDINAVNECKGLNTTLEEFDFAFLLCIFRRIFEKIDLLFQLLQAKASKILFCMKRIQETVDSLQKQRTPEMFQTTYNEAIKLTKVPVPKRKKSKRRWENFESGFSNEGETILGIEDQYRKLFYEVYDNILHHLTLRFSDIDKLCFFSLTDVAQFKSYRNKFPNSLLDVLQTNYPFFNTGNLKTELSLIYESKDLTKPPQELLKFLIAKELVESLPELTKLLQLQLTFPISSASTERSFSCLKRVKTHLRNRTGQERLSDLAKITIEKKLVNELDLDKEKKLYNPIIEKFATLKERRAEFLYK